MNQDKMVEMKKRIIIYFSNPAIGISGSIASILGILLSIYFYINSFTLPKLMYLVHPVKAAVFRIDQSSRLEVNFDNKPIEGDITAAQIAVWNDGKQPVRKIDILKPLTIITPKGIPILEAKIRKTSRDVVGLNLDTSKIENGEVTVLWNIMEQGDGGIIQLIYKGKEQVEISADAIVVGQSEVKAQKYQYSPRSFEEQRQVNKRQIYINLVGLILIAALLYSDIVDLIKKKPKMLKTIIIIKIVIVATAYIALMITTIDQYKTAWPPFGF